jgi:hypothetical protein
VNAFAKLEKFVKTRDHEKTVITLKNVIPDPLEKIAITRTNAVEYPEIIANIEMFANNVRLLNIEQLLNTARNFALAPLPNIATWKNVV